MENLTRDEMMDLVSILREKIYLTEHKKESMIKVLGEDERYSDFCLNVYDKEISKTKNILDKLVY